ncbi:MAG: FRG domain-containing protein [Oscillospiraceae bacterium]|nr:FRG domain-containing protein [Oscillospiraceae bacterium]
MYYKSETKINSLGEFIEETLKLKGAGADVAPYQWYRGHADSTWALVPKVQRGFIGSDEELFRLERKYTNTFQSKAGTLPIPKPRMDEYADWLTIMQHYNLPTRLLDWSRSPLVSLYFAVSNEKFREHDACVWVLSPSELNEHEKLEKPTITDDGDKYANSFVYNMSHKTISRMIFTAFRRWELSGNVNARTPDDYKFDHLFNAVKGKVAACYPVIADSRVYNQLAAFTVHNTKRKLEDFCDESMLKRIIIPHGAKAKLLHELSVCGITLEYIFPDFDHLANSISQV